MAKDNFQIAIQEALNFKAFEDAAFAARLELANKNIEDCCNYIFTQVKKSGRQGFTDEEVFDMAYFYYNSEEVEIDKIPSYKVVVNRAIELTPKEIEKARQEAKDKVMNEEYARLHGKTETQIRQTIKADVPKEEDPGRKQLSLF